VTSPARPPFSRYVAIGDSSTEGLEDPLPSGQGYRGWADRLAEHIAGAQDEPLEYANLAIRGLRLNEIRTTQFDDALAMRPDLMSIFGGVNDVMVPGYDSEALREDLRAMFSEARGLDITVLTLTVPDLSALSQFGRRLKEKMSNLNDIIRAEADRYGAVCMDFARYAVATDPRLWFKDRLHGNTLGHERVAAALAWRLGIEGFDESWADPVEGGLAAHGPATSFVSDLDWAIHYLAPWIGRGIRGVPHGLGVAPKRPVPTVVPKPQSAVAP
jgi:lysophospholipase L1-like esterase